MTDVVAWDLAQRVAVRFSGREPFADSYHYDALAPDFEELTAIAEQRVSETTGLVSAAGPARSRVADRPAWIAANLASFQRLLKPLTTRLGERMGSGPMAPITQKVAGAEVGALLGWMSTRVLGQYDLLVAEDEDPEDQDIVYYVGPNVLALEKRFAFPPREFRLWLALHEVTHRAQFTGIPWLRQHYLSLVDEIMAGVDPDPKRFLAAIGRVADDVREGRNPLDEGGLAAVLASPEQRVALDRVAGLMSLLEGHGDVTMDRAGADQIPSAERFGRVLRQRRQQANGAARLLQRLLGLEAKLAQYEQGERFIAAIEAVGGPSALDTVWEDPARLPTLAEIRDPDTWLARIDLKAA
ncbi:MAG TPA: zinc-dependent metalloprotease [Acidimicrobiales bacterium]|nr:zinc-dependent metalloprotease [Acidimicrobiales bacterium]